MLVHNVDIINKLSVNLHLIIWYVDKMSAIYITIHLLSIQKILCLYLLHNKYISTFIKVTECLRRNNSACQIKKYLSIRPLLKK